MSAVSAQTSQALRQAMARLLDGRPVRCDGALTIANLAREAGVSRATANRDRNLVTAFRQAIAARILELETPAALQERIRQLQTELTARENAERKEITRLRTTVNVLAQHVQALTLDNEALRQNLDTNHKLRTIARP